MHMYVVFDIRGDESVSVIGKLVNVNPPQMTNYHLKWFPICNVCIMYVCMHVSGLFIYW